MNLVSENPRKYKLVLISEELQGSGFEGVEVSKKIRSLKGDLPIVMMT